MQTKADRFCSAMFCFFVTNLSKGAESVDERILLFFSSVYSEVLPHLQRLAAWQIQAVHSHMSKREEKHFPCETREEFKE